MSLLSNEEIDRLESLAGEFRWAVVDSESNTILEDFHDPCSARLAWQAALDRGISSIEIKVLRLTVEPDEVVDLATRFWFEMNFGSEAAREHSAYIGRAAEYYLCR